MSLSEAEIRALVKAARADDGVSAQRAQEAEIRQLLNGLKDVAYRSEDVTPLMKLCAAGSDYGWTELQKATRPDLMALLSSKAKSSLRRDLRRSLVQITRPCFELEWKSFGLALNSIGIVAGPSDPNLVEKMFLRGKPRDRLFSLFKKFPVLANLWSQTIRQWGEHVTEVLVRFAADGRLLSRTFFGGRPLFYIANLRCGLSDRHHGGRTVTQVRFEAGCLIYKPRSGRSEREWFSLMRWMNRRSFQPKLRAARVLPRSGYCWMEQVTPASCKNEIAGRRFYLRMGAMIAAAHLLKAVDCHRDNLIASADHPILVDVDALWHVSSLTKTQSFTDVLYRTGFFPNSNSRSLQSRSSALGPAREGKHLPRLALRRLEPGRYRREIARGFARAWRCLLGTPKARAAFAARLRRIRSTERRWIYWATETYAGIRNASIQPHALRSGRERERLIRLRCARESVAAKVIEAEVRALNQLDIPYFVRRSNHCLPRDPSKVPRELLKAICTALPQSR